MLMHSTEGTDGPRHSIGRAIRAVEQQRAMERACESPETVSRRAAFFQLLDASTRAIFSGVERAAHSRERCFMLGTITGFDAKVASIFPDLGAGFFDTDVLAAWLDTRDLSHIFHATELGIEW
jgi:hypothetical protein